jgi:ribosomal protein L11 methyltransferase
MSWQALTLELAAAHAEAFSDALLDAGVESVALEAIEDVWDRQRLQALLRAGAPAEQVLERAAAAAGVSRPRFEVTMIEDEDWVRRSQAQFQPLAVGRLWIGPSWADAPPSARAAVRIDPGLAFGTGSHPSTRLALRFIEANVRGGERVLDYGCGSGILAIAAARLGAGRVDAVDIDPQAVKTCRANAAVNAVAVRAGLPEEIGAERYDIVVANILSQPLIILAPMLAARTDAGGRLALSGILVSQASEVAAAYAHAFALELLESDAGWALVGGARA